MMMANDIDPVTRRVYSWLHCVDWWNWCDDHLPPCTRDGAHSDRVRDTLVWALGRLAHCDAPADWNWMARVLTWRLKALIDNVVTAHGRRLCLRYWPDEHGGYFSVEELP